MTVVLIDSIPTEPLPIDIAIIPVLMTPLVHTNRKTGKSFQCVRQHLFSQLSLSNFAKLASNRVTLQIETFDLTHFSKSRKKPDMSVISTFQNISTDQRRVELARLLAAGIIRLAIERLETEPGLLNSSQHPSNPTERTVHLNR